MSDVPKHMTTRDFIPQEDGSLVIDTKSYHEQLSSHKQEREVRVLTTNQRYLVDLVSCAKAIEERQGLDPEIRVFKDKRTEPYLIVYKYTVKKDSYSRR